MEQNVLPLLGCEYSVGAGAFLVSVRADSDQKEARKITLDNWKY